MSKDTVCKWQYDKDYEFFETDCGQAFQFSHDEPFEDGKFKYCPYCGGKIEVSIKK